MNTTELRQGLDHLVADVTADGHFASGVAAKVRARRRARAAGVGAACVALLAIGAGATVQLTGTGARTPGPATSGHALPQPGPTMTGTDGMPTRAVPTAPGDIVKDGLRIRARVGGDSLAVGSIGDRGQDQMTLWWEPTTTHVSLGGECFLPGADKATTERIRLRLTLVGSTRSLGGGSCGSEAPRDLLPATWTPGLPGEGWEELTVGKPAQLRVQLVDDTGKPVHFGSARIAAAVYNTGPQSVIVETRTGKVVAALPEMLERDGYGYRLAGVTSRPAGERLPAVETPAGTPFFVTFGSAGVDEAPSSKAYVADGPVIRLEGLSTSPAAFSGNDGWTTAPQPARAAGTVQLVREGPKPSSGVDFVAIYTLEP